MNDTKQKLLDAAEQLFAAKGFAATSLRDITTLADANLASVNYHFGSKEALIDAVFERRLEPVNRERIELLDAYEAAANGAAVDLRQILWAYLAPPFRYVHGAGIGGRDFMRIVGRVQAAPGESISAAFLGQFETVKTRFHAALHRALPALSDDEVSRRMHHVIGAMAHTFCWSGTLACLRSNEAPESDAVLHSILGFALAGMQAPPANIEIPELPALQPAGAAEVES